MNELFRGFLLELQKQVECSAGGSCYVESRVIGENDKLYATAASVFANKAPRSRPSVQRTQASVTKVITIANGLNEAQAWEQIKREMLNG
jgi:hypothetical protein